MQIDITTFDIAVLHPELKFTAVFENGPANTEREKKRDIIYYLFFLMKYGEKNNNTLWFGEIVIKTIYKSLLRYTYFFLHKSGGYTWQFLNTKMGIKKGWCDYFWK